MSLEKIGSVPMSGQCEILINGSYEISIGHIELFIKDWLLMNNELESSWKEEVVG
jgi:hypothetical protein